MSVSTQPSTVNTSQNYLQVGILISLKYYSNPIQKDLVTRQGCTSYLLYSFV